MDATQALDFMEELLLLVEMFQSAMLDISVKPRIPEQVKKDIETASAYIEGRAFLSGEELVALKERLRKAAEQYLGGV